MTGVEVEVCWFEDEQWRGYVPTVRKEWQLPGHAFRTWVSGLRHSVEALTDPSFAPGSALVVVAEPDNPVDPLAVAVWNAARSIRAGYVPRHIADLMLSLSFDRAGVVLSEQVEDGVRVTLGILVSQEPISLRLVPSTERLAALVERDVREWKARFADSRRQAGPAPMDLDDALRRSIEQTRRTE